ncbi:MULTISPECIES: transposase [Marinovum]|uniref:transposase n=1 Tax=Marinovum TaxID=367771 RepID=UPI00237C3163|nr:transposase [Marinovum sp. PR37]MDD9746900.1 transposase [Marinovum sp. PR37]
MPAANLGSSFSDRKYDPIIEDCGPSALQGAMKKKCSTKPMFEELHWQRLAGRLPENGVTSVFSTDLLCRKRLAEVRWPGGVTCLECQSQDVGYLEGRKTYHCRNCRYQFTVLTRSLLGSSKLYPQLWFDAAEIYICWRARSGRHDYGLHAFADVLGVAYPTAHRVRKILEKDLALGGTGLLIQCICIDV